MYARVVTMSIEPDGFDTAVDYFEHTALPELKEFPGFLGATFLLNRYDHVTRSLTYWDGPGNLEASTEVAGRLRHALTEKIAGVEVVSVEVYEVAASYRPSAPT